MWVLYPIFKPNLCPCGEMDITTVFGTVVPGSSPGGGIRVEYNVRGQSLPAGRLAGAND